ncbi:MAG: methyltransferase domain-containing protein, partial [Candidatus Margulisiibacteriota bacterium]
MDRSKTCRLCGGNKMRIVLHLEPTPSGDAYVSKEKAKEAQPLYPLDLVLCQECGHSQLSEVVDPELLYSNYIYTTSISLGLADHFAKYVDAVLAYAKPAKGSLVVDIGSNDGTLLKAFKNKELQVLGVDPAPTAARKANESGIETINSYFTAKLSGKIKKERGSAAIITANNVFANIDDLEDIMIG